MIMKEYCDSMDKQLAAWRSHVGKLLVIAETIPGKDPATDAKQIEPALSNR